MDAFKPSAALLCKLGSLVVHMEEAMSQKAHNYDIVAIKSILSDNELKEWLAAMNKIGLIPVKRK